MNLTYGETRLRIERQGDTFCVVARQRVRDPNDSRLVYPLEQTLMCAKDRARARETRCKVAKTWRLRGYC